MMVAGRAALRRGRQPFGKGSFHMSIYLEKLTECLQRIEEEEKDDIRAAAEKAAGVIRNDGLIYVFGCGHSHLPGLDAFYRAGGLANVSPMLDTDLMLHNGAAKSGRMEKMPGIGREIYRRYRLTARDMLIVISASGKNSVPCEVAQCAVDAGVFTVGVSSSAYDDKGGRLHRIVPLRIDCKVPYGDACVQVGPNMMGGLSTAADCFILNSVLMEGARLAAEQGCEVPVWVSGNVENGPERNLKLEDRYMGRVRHL